MDWTRPSRSASWNCRLSKRSPTPSIYSEVWKSRWIWRAGRARLIGAAIRRVSASLSRFVVLGNAARARGQDPPADREESPVAQCGDCDAERQHRRPQPLHETVVVEYLED